MAVAWRSGSQQGVCRLGTMAIGGLFLKTPEPPSKGSTLELLFDVATGAQVRARAVVCNSMPGKGMGVKFVRMQAEDRSRLNQFLKAQIEAGNIQEEFPPAEAAETRPDSRPDASTAPAADTAADQSSAPSSQGPAVAQSERAPGSAEEQKSDRRAQDDYSVSEEELERYLALAEKGNHYQLLGVTSDAGYQEIRKGFYVLARKFHPDRHMDRPEWAKPLQQLMGAVTEAHKVLADETLRGNYDRKLTHRQTEAQETLEECVKLAAKAEREENREGAIFWMRKCVNIAPEVAKYRVSLASNMTAVPHFRREAVEHFQKAIELDQWNTEAYLNFGELYELLQLPWRAASLYSKILEFDPGHTLARQRLARSEAKEKKKNAPRMARLFSRK
jgi:tetratricopeptide (TPR) repeat protein